MGKLFLLLNNYNYIHYIRIHATIGTVVSINQYIHPEFTICTPLEFISISTIACTRIHSDLKYLKCEFWMQVALVAVHSGVNFSTLVVVVFLWLEQASKNTRGTMK